MIDDRRAGMYRAKREALESADRVRVLIALAMPEAQAQEAASQPTIAAARTAILSRLAPADFHLGRTFLSIPALAGDITAAGVLRLLDDPSVQRIDLDEGGTGGLVEGLPLMGVAAVRDTGFTGAGVTVTVLDSG